MIEAGYVFGAVGARFKPVWNRSRFKAVKAAVSIPVLAVGGIRTRAEARRSSTAARPTSSASAGRSTPSPTCPAASSATARPHEPGLCVSSNLCVPGPDAGDEGRLLQPRGGPAAEPTPGLGSAAVMSAAAWQAVLDRLDDAAALIGLDPDVHRMLRTCERVLEVSVPVRMDDGERRGVHRLAGAPRHDPRARARAASASTPTSTSTRCGRWPPG